MAESSPALCLVFGAHSLATDVWERQSVTHQEQRGKNPMPRGKGLSPGTSVPEVKPTGCPGNAPVLASCSTNINRMSVEHEARQKNNPPSAFLYLGKGSSAYANKLHANASANVSSSSEENSPSVSRTGN